MKKYDKKKENPVQPGDQKSMSFLLYKHLKLLALGLLVASAGFAQPVTGHFDPLDYGAKGDGQTVDTKAIQKAIDACHRSGRGKVTIHSGTFLSGTIRLKSHVTLDIGAGAVLKAANNVDEFPVTKSKYPSYKGKYVTNKMLIYAEDAENIGITGRGTIDGNGHHWAEGPYGSPSFSLRPRIIHFRGCDNILIRDVTLRNSASWVQSYQSCSNLLIEGITVDSRPNKDIEKPRFATAQGRNNDGLDIIDCRGVRITNCFINSGDDGICLKSLSPEEACRDIIISNCIVTTNASGIKIGTETAGGFRDILIQNCVVYDTRVGGISLMTVDGAGLERITISNISMRNIKGSAIFIRLGIRNRTYRKDAAVKKPFLKDIMIDNIQGTGISSGYGCSVTGITDLPVENITLSNINLEFKGGGKAEDAGRRIPELEKGYPNGTMFGTLPAYGFYIRHVKNLTLENIRLRFTAEDHRPALVCEDVESLDLSGLKAAGTLQTPGLIRLVNARNVRISDCRPTSPVAVFLSVSGDRTGGIILSGNDLKNTKRKYTFDDGAPKPVLKDPDRLY